MIEVAQISTSFCFLCILCISLVADILSPRDVLAHMHQTQTVGGNPDS